MILERLFKLKESGTTPRQELLGGMTTFMTMAYILIVNPSILSAAGMDSGAVFTATAVSSAVACLLMGLFANLPIALAPGLGINVFFAYTVVLQMGYSWEMALAAVFVEGVIFIIMSLLNIREKIINSIPVVLKNAISIGIGLFITTIGLVNSGIIVSSQPLSKLGDLSSVNVSLAMISIVVIGALVAKGVRGALLIGMFISAIIGVFMGAVTIPDGFAPVAMPHSIAPVFMQLDFSGIFSWEMLIVIFTFVFADLFDTAGSLFAICYRMGAVDEKGNIPKAKPAFLADAISTTVGAIVGTSTVTSYLESTAGVAAGGRTGLTAVVVGIMFMLSLVFAPVFALIPVAASSAVLIVVGLFMFSTIRHIDFDDYKNALPAFVTIIVTPLSYSISEGIVYGFLSYVLVRVLMGKFRDVSVVMYLLAIVFLLKEIFV